MSAVRHTNPLILPFVLGHLKPCHPRLLSAVLTAMAAVGAHLPAQAAQEVSELETLTITASGQETDVLNTPHAVTVLSKDDIAGSAADNVGDLLRGEPGLAVSADGAWGMNPVIRGLKKEQVVIMVDGVRLNSSQPYGSIASLVNLQQVERVEVVKGPVSVLYGSGAVGGVINLITRKADFSEQPEVTGSTRVSVSSADSASRAAATVAISNANHALNLNLSGMDVNDYETPEGEVPGSGYKQGALSANYRLRIGNQGVLELNAQHQKDRDVWYPGSTKPHPFHIQQTIHSPETVRSFYELAYAHEFEDEFDSRLRFNLYQQDVNRTINSRSARLERDVVRTDVTFSTLGAGLKMGFSPIDTHRVTLGADAWRMKGDPERRMDTNAPFFDNDVRNDPFDQGEIQSVGVFLQDQILLEEWSLKAGLRYDRVSGDAHAIAGVPAGTDLKKTDNNLSWSMGAVYHLSSSLNPYVNFSQAYRAPEMRERFESSPRGDGYLHKGNPQLESEHSTTLELGLKGRYENTSYTLAAYHSQIDDYIIGRITGMTHPGTGLPIKSTENLAEVTLSGVEATLEQDLGNDLLAFANFSMLRGENKYDNEPLAEVPPAEMTVGLRKIPQYGWNWDVAARLVAEQDRVGTKLTNNTEDSTPGFVTVDAAVGYRFAQTADGISNSVRLAVNNMLDKSYHEHLTTSISGFEPLAPGLNVHLSWNMGF